MISGVPPRTFVWATEKASICVAEVEVAEAEEPDQEMTSAVLHEKVIDLEQIDVNEIVDVSLSSLHVLVMTRTKLFACKRLTGKLAKQKDLSHLLTREGPLSYHGFVALNRDVAADGLRMVTEDGRVSIKPPMNFGLGLPAVALGHWKLLGCKREL